MHNNPYFANGHNSAMSHAITASHQAAALSHHHVAMALAGGRRAAAAARRAMAIAQRGAAVRRQRTGARALRGRPRQASASARNKFAAFVDALQDAVSKPVQCQLLHDHAGGKAVFFESNWTDPNDVPRAVFDCNTMIPQTGRRVSAFLLTEKGIELVDLHEGFGVASRGRLFVFAATVGLSDGRAFAVRPATSCLTAGGRPGFHSYATVGSIAGETFIIGHGSIGTFVSPAMNTVAAFRPIAFQKGHHWWVGRSSANRGAMLEFGAEALLSKSPDARTVFLLDPVKPNAEQSVVECARTDDHGDPIGLIDTSRPRNFGIIKAAGRLAFFALPNRLDSRGVPVFAVEGRLNGRGEGVIRVPFQDGEHTKTVELPTTHTGHDGRVWFARRTNVAEAGSGRMVVFIPLKTD